MQFRPYFDITPLERVPCSAMQIADPDDPAIKAGMRFGLSSLCTQGAQTFLCNQVAQTWASVPYSSQGPLPTMTAALVAARPGQGPNTNRAWQAFAHATHPRRTDGETSMAILRCLLLRSSAKHCRQFRHGRLRSVGGRVTFWFRTVLGRCLSPRIENRFKQGEI
jgi:hypothetical protein